VDIGDAEDIVESIGRDFIIKGIFVTHLHFDHIYRINKLIDRFPQCVVFSSEQGAKGLFSSKINLSFYHKNPVVFKGSKVQILHEHEQVELFENCILKTIETPGHDWSCLTYIVNDHLFTGDSFMPGNKVVTKLNGGEKEAAGRSIIKILDLIQNDTIVCPGHGANHLGDKIKKQRI
jgi:hydroxyacylglutathione hydrolase